MNGHQDEIFTEADHALFATLKILDVSVGPALRGKLTRGGGKWLVLLAHSAGGKSAALRDLGVSRDASDMDVFCQRHKLKKSAATLDRLCSEHRRQGGIVALSNDFELLDELEERRRNEKVDDYIFLYIKRPMQTLLENLKLKNTDGIYHRKVEPSDYAGLYEKYNANYKKIADIEVYYAGYRIEDLANIISHIHQRVVATTVGKEKNKVKGTVTNEGIENPFSAGAPDTHPFFRDYNALRAAAAENPGIATPPSQADMRKMTAGGYQVFDTAVFPPLPQKNSIADKKLRDLKWTEPEFAGMRVLEIGSQLGFFAFRALGLGASMVLGIEQNSRFAAEANKLALHYKKLCRWQADLARFGNMTLMPGDAIPPKPDIIVANSIFHWWIIQDKTARVAEILEWLKAGCEYAVYFEGCVDASEPILTQHEVAPERYNEQDFVKQCERVFRTVQFVGRCSYNDKRIVLRLLK